MHRRLPVPAALQHPLREDLFRLIREKPGIHESQLARDLGLRHTHVQYHLRVLEEAGLVELRRYAGLKCAFEMGKHSSEEKDMLLAGRGRVRHVLNVVLAEPGLSQRALAHRLGMSESSVKWHLDRLQGAGLVRTERCDGAKLAWPAKQGPDSSG